MKADEIARILECSSPDPLEGDEYGLVFGNPHKEVKKIGIVWRIQKSLLNKIITDNVDLLIVHEALFQKARDSKWSFPVSQYAQKYNNEVEELLKQNDITVYRYHSNFDAWENIGVVDSFGQLLGLSNEIGRGKFTRTYTIGPLTLGELSDYVQSKLPHCPIRCFGDNSKTIDTVSTMIGGFGGNQPLMPFEIADQGGQAIIVGDLTEKVLLNALELGLFVIETLHSVTEEYSLKQIQKFLNNEIVSIDVAYYDSGAYLYNA